MKSLMEDNKEQRDAEAPHSSEPQKAYPTGEFVYLLIDWLAKPIKGKSLIYTNQRNYTCSFLKA